MAKRARHIGGEFPLLHGVVNEPTASDSTYFYLPIGQGWQLHRPSNSRYSKSNRAPTMWLIETLIPGELAVARSTGKTKNAKMMRDGGPVSIAMDVGSTVSLASAVVAALVAILGVIGYQNRRAKLSAVRSAFNDVIGALAAADKERQLAGAVLLRRFFDRGSELGMRDLFGRRRTPYAREALNVLAAVLRGMPSGDLQKLLADGLAHAETLEGADLQRTNLQDAYLSPRASRGSLEHADFYRADLGGASLKDARAAGAKFYQARLQDTVLRGADLRNANFFEADLSRAVFAGALLEGALFTGARNVPAELVEHVGKDGRYMSSAPAPARGAEPSMGKRVVFLSLPSERTPVQDAIRERVENLCHRAGLITESLSRRDYPTSGALGEIFRRLSGCAGVVVFGLREVRSSPHEGQQVGATPWAHVEAGMAYGCGLPLLLVREVDVRSGAFDDAVIGHRTFALDIDESWNADLVHKAIEPWVFDVCR